MKRQPTPTPGRAQLRNLGSLITYRDTGSEHCLGYLLSFEGHGVFDPDLGRIEVTPEEANAHNRALSQAEIQGLDQNCQVGQGGYFYLKERTGTVGSPPGPAIRWRLRCSGKAGAFAFNAMARPTPAPAARAMT